jgi:hypothetical protein
MGLAVVKIRYAELPAGLHVATRVDGQGTIIYLLPGLTPAQRRAALIRVRSSARMGQGPELPRLQMTMAVAADRVRVTAGNCGVAVRRHPMLVFPPMILLVCGAVALALASFGRLPSPAHSHLPATPSDVRSQTASR